MSYNNKDLIKIKGTRVNFLVGGDEELYKDVDPIIIANKAGIKKPLIMEVTNAYIGICNDLLFYNITPKCLPSINISIDKINEILNKEELSNIEKAKELELYYESLIDEISNN